MSKWEDEIAAARYRERMFGSKASGTTPNPTAEDLEYWNNIKKIPKKKTKKVVILGSIRPRSLGGTIQDYAVVDIEIDD